MIVYSVHIIYYLFLSTIRSFYVLLTVHLNVFFLVINEFVAQNFCFTINLFNASTFFGHMCSSSGSQNFITGSLDSLAFIQTLLLAGCFGFYCLRFLRRAV